MEHTGSIMSSFVVGYVMVVYTMQVIMWPKISEGLGSDSACTHTHMHTHTWVQTDQQTNTGRVSHAQRQAGRQ